MILDKIVESTRIRVERAKQAVPVDEMKAKAEQSECSVPFVFEHVLANQNMSFICEVKKASPSKGLIARHFPYIEIAKEYEEAGADCISVLTEPEFFQGSNQYLQEIVNEVSIPVLRKDFTIDAYQIYEAKVLGASAVLLICALLDTERLREYLSICNVLGLSALVEAHDETEIASAIEAGARIIGVNNRDLKTFEVDIANSIRLRNAAPKEILFIGESGICSRDDVAALEAEHVNGVLIGETMMRSDKKKEMLNFLRGI